MNQIQPIPNHLQSALDVVYVSRCKVTPAVLNSFNRPTISASLQQTIGFKRNYSMMEHTIVEDDQKSKHSRSDESSLTPSIDPFRENDESVNLDFVHQRTFAEYLLKNDQLNAEVNQIIAAWGNKMKDIDPVDYLQHLLKTRGYDHEYFESSDLTSIDPELQYKRTVDYGCDIVNAVRLSDVVTLTQMQELGRCMSACNRYSESIVHMACRRSTYATVKYILDNIHTLALVDDYGRTPLHDACWRSEPCFAIVALIMDSNLDLVRCKDRRGSTPLHYVRREHWQLWCAFLDHQKEIYWAPIKPQPVSVSAATATAAASVSTEQSQVRPDLW
jgi:hypothetical protein